MILEQSANEVGLPPEECSHIGFIGRSLDWRSCLMLHALEMEVSWCACNKRWKYHIVIYRGWLGGLSRDSGHFSLLLSIFLTFSG